ncbi:DUF3048 domain-containing protein [Kroppenstedtia guangzhouensis]|uniref:DUF3048 domain-containing protein n=1 Tax=Kroppenstedtia guangzhouensis TaxID=1274356 RepID=UPI00166BB3AF|nr:DUF3048 domain-containing protein [Kroppenstedtia guangzhouensis]
MRYRVLIEVGVILWMVAGCSLPRVLPPDTETSGEKEIRRINPLTGKEMEKETSGRPWMVMVNNQAQARPQSGLDRADLVAEVLAEGEITRFAAFYYGVREGVVGPIRSVRPYYLDLARGPQAVVTHAGGSPKAMERIREERFPSLDGIHGDSRWFYRVNFRQPPHNLYTDLEKLREGAEKKGYAEGTVESPYIFSRKEPDKGKAASRIDLRYHRLYRVEYGYDPKTGRYIRYTQGKKQVDREKGTPLSMENVLVIRAPHRVIDSSGRREVSITDGGEGMLFRGGKAWPLRWEYRQGWIVPLMDGKTAPLAPGKTWINVLPVDGGLKYGK